MKTEESIARMASYCLTASGVKVDQEALALDVIKAREITEAPPIGVGLLVAFKHQNSLPDCETAASQLSDLFAPAEKQHVETSKPRLKRTDIGKIHGKQVEQMQEVVAKKLAAHFRKSVRDTADRIAKRGDEPDPGNAERQATKIVKATFNLETARKDLFKRASEILPAVFAAGTMAELEILESLIDESKQTTAEEIAARLEIDVSLLPFSIGRMPEWLLAAARETMGEVFTQDYWQKIPEATRDDIRLTLRDGIERGLSMRKVSKQINELRGDEYSKTRAMTVARTETADILNAGHSAGMTQLEEDTGLSIGREWVSAFQTFSRESHLSMDGKRTKNSAGLFNLQGHKIPWPAHFSLPAGLRINCLCVIISAVSADQLE